MRASMRRVLLAVWLLELNAAAIAATAVDKATILDNDQLAVWWTHPCVKVFPNDAPPAHKQAAGPLYAARGETEAVQIVLRPKQTISGITATVSDFDGPSELPASMATLRWVAYVPVKQASGAKGGTGAFPDPLPRRAPTNIAASQNQPVWITLRVPASAKAGDYWQDPVKLESLRHRIAHALERLVE